MPQLLVLLHVQCPSLWSCQVGDGGKNREKQRKPGCLESQEERTQVEPAVESREDVKRGFGKRTGYFSGVFRSLQSFWMTSGLPDQVLFHPIAGRYDLWAPQPPGAIFSLAPVWPLSPQSPLPLSPWGLLTQAPGTQQGSHEGTEG